MAIQKQNGISLSSQLFLKGKKKQWRSENSKVKKRAISELENPSTIYMLGGNPAYVHSYQTYFRYGLKTAEEEMTVMLNNMVASQKQKMKVKADMIDEEWAVKLRKAFKGEINTFPEFQSFWNNSIMNKQNPNSLAKKLEALTDLKTAKVRANALKKFKQDALNHIQIKYGKQPSEAGAQALADKLQLYGIEVSLSKNKDTYSYSGFGTDLEKEWNRIIRKNTNILLNSSENIYDTLVEQQIKTINPSKKNKQSLDDKKLGNLFETDSVGFFSGIIQDIDKNKTLDLIVENIAGEKIGESTISNKADTNFILQDAFSKEIVLQFATSDKLSQSLEKHDDIINSPIVEQFSVALRSDTLDFSNYKIDDPIFNKDNVWMQKLFNYVFANAAAFSKQVSIQNFKELIILYAAWLKILTEIIGDTDINRTPLAIRTAKTIYNTADLIRLFINLDVRGMLDNGGNNPIVKSMLEKYYSPAISLLNTTKDGLFSRKRMALAKLGSNASYENLKDHPYINSYLNGLAGEINRPSFSTYIVIKFKNWKQLSKGVI